MSRLCTACSTILIYLFYGSQDRLKEKVGEIRRQHFGIARGPMLSKVTRDNTRGKLCHECAASEDKGMNLGSSVTRKDTKIHRCRALAHGVRRRKPLLTTPDIASVRSRISSYKVLHQIDKGDKTPSNNESNAKSEMDMVVKGGDLIIVRLS